MEFACIKLQELLESLNKTSGIFKWSSHVNNVGTLIKIQYKHKIPAIPQDSSTSIITRESTSCSDQNLTPESYSGSSESSVHVEPPPPEAPIEHVTTNRLSDNRVSEPSESTDKPENSTSTRTVFKPISNYQMKRDKKRLDRFKSKKNSPQNRQMTTRSQTKLSTTQHSDVELARGLDSDSRSHQTKAISPEKPDVDQSVTSPWADKNPFSPLPIDPDSPTLPQNPLAGCADMCSESSGADASPVEDLYDGPGDDTDTEEQEPLELFADMMLADFGIDLRSNYERSHAGSVT